MNGGSLSAGGILRFYVDNETNQGFSDGNSHQIAVINNIPGGIYRVGYNAIWNRTALNGGIHCWLRLNGSGFIAQGDYNTIYYAVNNNGINNVTIPLHHELITTFPNGSNMLELLVNITGSSFPYSIVTCQLWAEK